VARTATPLRKSGRKTFGHAADAPAAPEPQSPHLPLPEVQATRRHPHGHSRLPPLAGVDAREVRRLGRGHVAIEARVDLHGLRQREAHLRLKTFLFGAQARGVRHALVITGKGARAEEPATFWESNDRGVLKRLVPQWLSEPEFRSLVVGFTTAQTRHGGEGALYVRLRRRR
jgi:DNA-nicking Smr family endonuclease